MRPQNVKKRSSLIVKIFRSRSSRDSQWHWCDTPAAARRPSWACSRNFICPSAGRVLEDNLDLKTVTSDSLRSPMGSVQQNHFLFSGPVLDNIRLEEETVDIQGATESRPHP